MGIYLNPGNTIFYNAVNYSQIYVDKTELIAYTNAVLFGEHKEICVSRPRRFGKSMAANMLVAYYSRGCDSRELFQNLKIAQHPDFEKHLNRYNVIHINMMDLWNRFKSVDKMISYLQKRVIWELKQEFGDVNCFDWDDMITVMESVFLEKKQPFIAIIDEWDCPFREIKNDEKAQEMYLDFLELWMKNKSYVALSYMTGILPIKKYGDQSALNMFDEYSMTNAEPIEEFTGFTEEEVIVLCQEYNMDFGEMKKWYDGYSLNHLSIYNPKSVVEAINRKRFDNYWTKTETYESIRHYINMDFDGLRTTITELISGGRKKIDTTTFTNDMVSFAIQDDVLTLLIHLGYLGYDFDTKEIFIPNYEIREQFVSTVRVLGWNNIIKSIQLSEELLAATLQMDEEKVAEIIEQVHDENIPFLKYNDENSLTCVLSLAYYSARKDYEIFRELAGGKGYADLVFVPRASCKNPAILVELKYNQSEISAIEQIKMKQYVKSLKGYSGEVLLVGINYSEKEKSHTCKIEKMQKGNA